MRRSTLILLLLLPPAAFVASLYRVNALFDADEIRNGILLFMGSLTATVIPEFLLLRYVALPRWGQAVGERLYAGSYSPGEDRIVACAETIRRTGDESLLPRLEALVQADPTRMRSWRELADVRLNVFHRTEEAVLTLLEAEKHVRDKEDKALLLYRAAQWTENRLHRSTRAEELYSLLAERYPATVYGSRAAKRQS